MAADPTTNHAIGHGLPFMKVSASQLPQAHLQPTVMMLHEDFSPGDWDVICQRGKDSFEHVGNKRFRKCIDDHIDIYLNAATRQEKSTIVTKIYEKVRFKATKPHGGFVKKDLLTRSWFQVSEKEARDKVGQALRDAIKIIRATAKKAGASKHRANTNKGAETLTHFLKVATATESNDLSSTSNMDYRKRQLGARKDTNPLSSSDIISQDHVVSSSTIGDDFARSFESSTTGVPSSDTARALLENPTMSALGTTNFSLSAGALYGFEGSSKKAMLETSIAPIDTAPDQRNIDFSAGTAGRLGRKRHRPMDNGLSLVSWNLGEIHEQKNNASHHHGNGYYLEEQMLPKRVRAQMPPGPSSPGVGHLVGLRRLALLGMDQTNKMPSSSHHPDATPWFSQDTWSDSAATLSSRSLMHFPSFGGATQKAQAEGEFPFFSATTALVPGLTHSEPAIVPVPTTHGGWDLEPTPISGPEH